MQIDDPRTRGGSAALALIIDIYAPGLHWPLTAANPAEYGWHSIILALARSHIPARAAAIARGHFHSRLYATRWGSERERGSAVCCSADGDRISPFPRARECRAYAQAAQNEYTLSLPKRDHKRRMMPCSCACVVLFALLVLSLCGLVSLAFFFADFLMR